MIDIHLIKKSLLVLPLTIMVYLSEIIITLNNGVFISSDDISFADAVFGMIFNVALDRKQNEVFTCLFGQFLPILFSILFGTYIYNDLRISSVYYFIRQKNKRKWYLNKILNLMLSTFIYTLISILIPISLCLYETGENLSFNNFLLLVVIFFSLYIFTLIITLLINIFSVLFGSLISFLIVYSYIILQFFWSLKMEENNSLLYLNFSYCATIPWQDKSEFIITFIVSLLHFFIIAILGYIFISRKETIHADKENLI